MEIDLVQFHNFASCQRNTPKELTSTLCIAALAKVWRLGDERKTHKLHKTKQNKRYVYHILKIICTWIEEGVTVANNSKRTKNILQGYMWVSFWTQTIFFFMQTFKATTKKRWSRKKAFYCRLFLRNLFNFKKTHLKCFGKIFEKYFSRNSILEGIQYFQAICRLVQASWPLLACK